MEKKPTIVVVSDILSGNETKEIITMFEKRAKIQFAGFCEGFILLFYHQNIKNELIIKGDFNVLFFKNYTKELKLSGQYDGLVITEGKHFKNLKTFKKYLGIEDCTEKIED